MKTQNMLLWWAVRYPEIADIRKLKTTNRKIKEAIELARQDPKFRPIHIKILLAGLKG